MKNFVIPISYFFYNSAPKHSNSNTSNNLKKVFLFKKKQRLSLFYPRKLYLFNKKIAKKTDKNKAKIY